MNQLTTNPCTNIKCTEANFNATLVSRDNDLYAYGFVFIQGNSGDPRVGGEGVYAIATGGNPPENNYSMLSTTPLFGTSNIMTPSTHYRVAAIAMDSVTGEYFYGETVDLLTAAITPFTGTVKIEGILFTGLAVTVGTNKTFPSLGVALSILDILYDQQQIVVIAYDSGAFSGNELVFANNEYCIVGANPDVIITSGDMIEFKDILIIENIEFDFTYTQRYLKWSGTDEAKAIVKMNRVKLRAVDVEATFNFGWDTLLQHPTLRMTNCLMDARFATIESVQYIYGDNMTLVKCSYVQSNVYEDGYIQGGVALYDVLIEGTEDYGPAYGTAGLLIEITDTPTPPSTGKKVMIKRN